MLSPSCSVKSYGKIDEAAQAKLDRRRSRRKVTIITVSSVVLVALIVTILVGSLKNPKHDNDHDHGHDRDKNYPSLSSSVRIACDQTSYKETCYNSLMSKFKNSSGSTQHASPHDIFRMSVQVASSELARASSGNSTEMSECRDLLSLALDHIADVMSRSGGDLGAILDSGDDLKTWLSTAGTCQQTCIDGFEEIGRPDLKTAAERYLKSSGEMTSNSIAILSWICRVADSFKINNVIPHSRKLLKDDHQSRSPELEGAEELRRRADIVVAKDGSGKYKTITEALAAVPGKSMERFVIYVKKGVYYGNVTVEKHKWNVTLVGDGMEETVVSASRSNADGFKTIDTATFAVLGRGFMARDMGFQNTAGAAKHQAVALRSTADMSVFYRCRIDAFQDSLYAHANRQFYRECDIYGTVDFIFGNAAVVIQNCNILPRVPMRAQKNTITAQGRFDPHYNTGISIQNCTISPFGDLSGVETYLGRPWKNHSTTVYMNSMLGGLIHPSGWLPWVEDVLIYYAEYKNFGPGSSTEKRVKWRGIREISSNDAAKFTVNGFIEGEKWIPGTNVSYNPWL